jgi:anti-sigma B factor antagonist
MDESILQAAERLGFLDATRLAACRALLAQEGSTVAKALAKAGRLSPHQIRAAALLARYDRARAEDLALGADLVRTGSASDAVVRACLAEQGTAFDRCDPLPTLSELLARRGLKTLVPKSQSAKRATPGVPHATPQPALAGGFRLAVRRAHGPRPEMEVAIVDIAGSLDADPASLTSTLEEIVGDGTVRIAVNAENLDSISAAGLEALQAGAARCRDAGGDLRVCALSERVRKLFDAAIGATVLQTYENERGAVNSFKYL